ncbi:hypothetical protein GF325_06205 [Candidatus Bathyarchaeota archaeon]|nr:hypothetical protein [Candidatus Bathyarchaeota archaeon]
MKAGSPMKMLVTDDNKIARKLLVLLEKRRRHRHSRNSIYYYKVRSRRETFLIVSTNGHLQVFQNSSIYKWTGIDPRKIIEDPNSVIPILNAFNKDNYYNLQNSFTRENITECILAISPDITSLTIMIKELGNLLGKVEYDDGVCKIPLVSLEPRYIFHQLKSPSPITFKDRKLAEAEYLRSYLDAIISFSMTQQLTYTIKRCIKENPEAFDELHDVLKKDLRNRKNLLIPISRVQALILNLVHENTSIVEERNNQIDGNGEYSKLVELSSKENHGSQVVHSILVKVRDDSGNLHRFKVDASNFNSEEDARGFINKVQGMERARIKDLKEENEAVFPPALHEVSSLVEEIASIHGFPTTYTYKILQDLYHDVLISYPNPIEFKVASLQLNHGDLISACKRIEELEDVCREIEDDLEGGQETIQGISARINEQENVILPLRIMTSKDPPFKNRPNHWKVYSEIVKRYVMQFTKPATRKVSRFTLSFKRKLECKAISSSISKEGFLSRFPAPGMQSAGQPNLDVLKSIEIEGFTIDDSNEKITYLTDASLLKKIKETDLGDTVSFLLMIEKLIANNYLQVVNKHLKLTKRGTEIVKFLQYTYDFLGSVDFSKHFVESIKSLEHSTDESDLKRNIAQLKEDLLRNYLEKFDESRERANTYLISKGIQDLDSREPGSHAKSRFETIPETMLFCSCGSPMRTIETKHGRRFLACENRLECGNTAALPNDGKITVLTKTCSICNGHVLKIDDSNRGIYLFCPNCWTQNYRTDDELEIGYCATCVQREYCWTDDDDEDSLNLLWNLRKQHEKAIEICPRCQKWPMMVLEADDNGLSTLACENPFCSYRIDIPTPIARNLTPTTKKCLICPMNAAKFKARNGKEYHVCPNCLHEYYKTHRREIGFCMGCVYHDACFIGRTIPETKKTLKEAVQKNLEQQAVNPE